MDTIVELRRHNPQEAGDRRRKLRAYGRFDETPAEIVVELTDKGYRSVGSTGDANRSDRQQVIEQILTDSICRTVDEIREQWLNDTIPKPGKRTIQADLNHGFESGKWQRDGKGTRGNPYKYKFDSRTVQLLGTSIESNGDPSEWGEV